MTDHAYTESIRQATEPTPTRYLPLPIPVAACSILAANLNAAIDKGVLSYDERRDLIYDALSHLTAGDGVIARLYGVTRPTAELVSEPDPRLEQTQAALRTLADLTVKGHDATERVLDHVVRMAKRDSIAETLDARQQVPPATPAGAQQRIADLNTELAQAHRFTRTVEAERDEALRLAEQRREQVDRQTLTIRAYMQATHTTDPEDVSAYGLHDGQGQPAPHAGLISATNTRPTPHDVACANAIAEGLHKAGTNGKDPDTIYVHEASPLRHWETAWGLPLRATLISPGLAHSAVLGHRGLGVGTVALPAPEDVQGDSWTYSSTTAEPTPAPPADELVLHCAQDEDDTLTIGRQLDEDDELRVTAQTDDGQYVSIYPKRSDVVRLRDHLTAVLGDSL